MSSRLYVTRFPAGMSAIGRVGTEDAAERTRIFPTESTDARRNRTHGLLGGDLPVFLYSSAVPLCLGWCRLRLFSDTGDPDGSLM